MRYLLILMLFASIIGCKKVRELTYFNINQSTTLTIPATNVVGVGSIPAVPVTNNAQSEFKKQGTEDKYVEEVKLQDITLSIQSPQGHSFNFLNSIKIFISAPGHNETLLASKENVPENVSSFSLETTGENLDRFIKADSYSLRIETVTDELLSEEVKILTEMIFRVRAKVL